MKKIGQGLQFNVYLKKNTVVKIPTSNFQILSKLITWSPVLVLRPVKLIKQISEVIYERREAIEAIQRSNINLELFANPIFMEDRIEQDRVELLREYLNRDFEESKKWINKYISLIFECWKYGFSDRVFNLTINNGVGKSGKVVLVDFGEVTFEKSQVKKAIESKRWEKACSFKRDMNRQIRKYYQKRMNEEMTLKHIDKYWKEKSVV